MTGKVAIITRGSQGIGAGLVAGLGGDGSARMIKPSEDPDVLTVEGDIAEPATADRIIGAALELFGRIDTLVNNAGAFISKPFTDYTAADYATVVGVNLTRFSWLTPRAMPSRPEVEAVIWKVRRAGPSIWTDCSPPSGDTPGALTGECHWCKAVGEARG